MSIAWSRVIYEDGVRVFQRSYPDSSILEVRGVVTTKATPDTIRRLLIDPAELPHWFLWCQSWSPEPASAPGTRNVIHISLSPGFPFSTRRLKTQWRFSKNEITLAETLQFSTRTEGPGDSAGAHTSADQPGAELELSGFVQFTPLSDGTSQIIYQSHFEPGGYVPTFWANHRMKHGMFRSMQTLRARLEMPKAPQE